MARQAFRRSKEKEQNQMTDHYKYRPYQQDF